MAVKCPKCHFENPEDTFYCGKCATPLPSAKDISLSQTETLQAPIKELATGSTFAGRYQVIEELGKGGMGRVYKVFDNDIKEKVALKLLKPEIASDRETIERFSNELKYARKIRHKNVCGMYDLGKAEGTHFITMEYVQGEDLKSMIRMAAGLSIGAVLSIGKQICDGLAEAHSLGVVHRDLKPQNIMIDKGGNAKIMDFGIARSIMEKGITGPSVLIGTPEYMSPEQAEAKEVDYRSDIYSLGIILYEMATGRVPFEGETALSIAMKHKGEIPKNPKQFNPNIPDYLSSVILKCLEKNKADRYQTAAEVRSELGKIEKGIPTTERVVPEKKAFTSKEITVTFGLKKALLPALGLLFLVTAAIVIWQILPKKAAAPAASAKKSIAVLPFEDLSQAKNNESFCDGISDTLINALTNIEGLWVPARSSAFFFKGKTQDVREIGRKLGVENVLEGSVQVAGDNFRITAQISNTQDGRQIWSEIYNRKMTEIFAIQDEISLEIVDKLKLELLKDEKTKVLKRYTNDKDAYNLYLKGRYFWNRRNARDMQRAIEYYRQAVEKDPQYALAYIGIADHFIMLGLWSYIPPAEAHLRAKEALDKALEIDDQLGEAYTSLGYFNFLYEWDWAAALTNFKRGLALNPRNVWAHAWHGCTLAGMGRSDEAIAELKTALEMEPLSPIINAIAGNIISFTHVDEGEKQLYRAIEMEPNLALAHLWLGQIYMFPEAVDERALEHLQTAVDLGLTFSLGWLGCAYARLGKKEEAFKILSQLDELSKERYVSYYSRATVYSGLEMYDQAFECLEKAYSQKEPLMASFGYSTKVPSPFSREFRLDVDERLKALRSKKKKIDRE